MTRINTNVVSLIAQNSLGRSNADLSQALTRLSTGLRINTGKDDPAGLIASENLRSDITAIRRAISNTDRANQVIATADSALGQVSSLLNDIRGLVTESANTGALSDDQLAANQLQLDSSLEALNRIAQTTTFQGRRLLDGSLDFIIAAGTSFSSISDLKIDQANLGATGSVSVDISVTTAATGAQVDVTNIPAAAIPAVQSTGSFNFGTTAAAGLTVTAWFVVAEAVEQLRLAEATLASFRASADQVRERYEAGIRPSLDYRLSLANLKGAEANLYNRRQQLDLAKRQLEMLLGRYPEAGIGTPTELGATPPEIPAGIPSELVARRPDLTAAERRLVASGELVHVAKAARYPRLSLTATGGTATRALTDLLDGNFSVWSIVGNLVQPIFEGGRIRAGIERAEAVEDEGLASYINAVLNAYLEVERALAAEDFLAAREKALGEASLQSTAAESLAYDRYRSGLEDYVTVLESQRRSFDAESAWISVRRLRLDNRVGLYLALGGGFDRGTRPELPAELDDEIEDEQDG